MQSLLFFNFSDTEFTHSYDGVPYTFKPFQQVYLEDFKAHHFAKHLVDRELQRCKKLVTDGERQSLLSKAIPSGAREDLAEPVVEAELSPPAKPELKLPPVVEIAKPITEMVAEEPATEPKKKRFCEFCDSKARFHKKDCKRPDKEFPDLK
jgi:uncharacterized membrane protein